MLAQFSIDKRNLSTRKAYEKDINDFFRLTTGNVATTDSVLEFLHLDRAAAVSVVLNYKTKLFEKGLAESTVNHRLASIRSLATSMGRKIGHCEFTLEDVKGERVQQNRDPSGITAEQFGLMLDICDRTKIGGIRDYALLKLLWDNALRRNEVSLLSYGDFDPSSFKRGSPANRLSHRSVYGHLYTIKNFSCSKIGTTEVSDAATYYADFAFIENLA